MQISCFRCQNIWISQQHRLWLVKVTNFSRKGLFFEILYFDLWSFNHNDTLQNVITWSHKGLERDVDSKEIKLHIKFSWWNIWKPLSKLLQESSLWADDETRGLGPIFPPNFFLRVLFLQKFPPEQEFTFLPGKLMPECIMSWEYCQKIKENKVPGELMPRRI